MPGAGGMRKQRQAILRDAVLDALDERTQRIGQAVARLLQPAAYGLGVLKGGLHAPLLVDDASVAATLQLGELGGRVQAEGGGV